MPVWSRSLNGPAADRPLATAVAAGTLYFSEDTGEFSWSDGTDWAGILLIPLSPPLEYTDDHTLELADIGKLVEMNKATAVTLTIPLDSAVDFPIGSHFDVLATGAGQITIAITATGTLNGAPGLLLTDQWSAVTLIKRAADTWVAIGRLSA